MRFKMDIKEEYLVIWCTLDGKVFLNYSFKKATFEAVCTTQGRYHQNSRIIRVTSETYTIREKTNKIIYINFIIAI